MGYDEYISNETKGVAKDQDCGVRNLNKAGFGNGYLENGSLEVFLLFVASVVSSPR